MLIINSAGVQTWLAQRAAKYLSTELQTEVQIGHLEIDFLNRLTLEGLLIFDQQGDTLVYAQKIDLSVLKLVPQRQYFRFGELQLTHTNVNLKALDSLGASNIDFIVDYFSEGSVDSSHNQLSLKARRLKLRNCSFSYKDDFALSGQQKMNFNNLTISEINTSASNFILEGDSLDFAIKQFNFIESSGFRIKKIASQIHIDSKHITMRDLSLMTGQSKLYGYIDIRHGNWNAYQHFVSQIELQSELDSALLSLEDISYFTKGMDEAQFSLNISGRLSGTIDNLKGRDIFFSGGERTVLRGNFDITGLPDAKNAFIDIRIRQLSSDYDDIARIGSDVTGNPDFQDKLPIELERTGSLFFEGSFTGFPQDFVAYGDLHTDAGFLDLDLNLKSDSANNDVVYDGGVKAKQFDIGRLLDQKGLGTVTAELDITALSKEKLIAATLLGTIYTLEYKNYSYNTIEIDGTVSSKKFTGSLRSGDPNLNFDFDGVVDLNGAEPFYNFNADIYNADLSNLQLVKMDKPFSFSSKLSLNAQGNSINKVNGLLTAFDSYICYGDSLLYLDSFRLTAAGNITNRKISFVSDFVDIALTGAFDVEQLPQAMNNLLGEVMPSMVAYKPMKSKEIFDFSINYKKRNVLTNMFIPDLKIAPQSTAYGNFNSQKRDFKLLVRSDSLTFDGYRAEALSLDLGKVSEVIKGKIYANKIDAKGLTLENFDLDMEAYNDITRVGLGWINSNDALSGNLEAKLAVIDKNRAELFIEQGFIGSDQSVWTIDSAATVHIDSSNFTFENLVMRNRHQELAVRGAISENPMEQLTINIKDFDFATLDSIGFDLNKSVQGQLNMDVTLTDFYKERVVNADLAIIDLIFEHYQIGNITANSRYYGDEKALGLSGRLDRRSLKILDFTGEYTLGSSKPLSAKLMLDGFDLNILNAFNIPEVNDYGGKANGEINIKGNFANPTVNGFIDFEEAQFKVEYLNTYFTFSDRLRIEDGWFGIDYKPINDAAGHTGFVVASAFHEDYHNWNYDISVEADNFFLMNTTREMNQTYYGTAYGTGTVQIGGYEGFVEINIDAITDKGTAIKLPLDNQEDVTLENFVYFVNAADTSAEERERDLNGIQLRLNIEATPDAEVQLIFDERTGEIIKGRGAGKLTLEIAPTGEFLMFGRYEITEGSYLFTLQNLINKQFQIRSGGYIGWYGDPYVADIDLTATYTLRTPLYPIMVENQERYRGREDVNVVLNLGDKLLNPSIGFDVELPQASATERSQLASATSTTQQLNQQVFALLILNRFLPVNDLQDNQAVAGVSGLGSATTSDFVSTQISNWLSEISDDFDIGLKYRPGDQISNQEVAVALSTQLFNERLSVSGNFGVTSASGAQSSGYRDQTQTGVLGDFLVQYQLTEDGRIRLNVFNQTNPYQVFSTSSTIYTQGVGLIYQEDFDTVDEFFKELKGLFTNDRVVE